MNKLDSKNINTFMEVTNISETELTKFIDYLLTTITERELLNLNCMDLKCLYEAYELQLELICYRSLEELGEYWARFSSLFEDDPDPDFEEIGQFYIDNYNNNYSGPSDICIKLHSDRILTVD